MAQQLARDCEDYLNNDKVHSNPRTRMNFLDTFSVSIYLGYDAVNSIVGLETFLKSVHDVFVIPDEWHKCF